MATPPAPHRIETPRLVLRKPAAADAAAIFARYAADPEVTKYLGWAQHRRLADTQAFLVLSDAIWERWPAGPYLIESREDGQLLGGTGLGFESPDVAMTGYVLAKDAWGKGYATEALSSMVNLAARMGVRRLYALCHPENAASRRVLEKCGFVFEATQNLEFPNLGSGGAEPCLCFARPPGYSE